MTEPVDGLVDSQQAALLLDVPVSLIWSWKNRRRAVPVEITRGRGPDRGSPIYQLEELRPLAEAYHQRQTRRVQRS